MTTDDKRIVIYFNNLFRIIDLPLTFGTPFITAVIYQLISNDVILIFLYIFFRVHFLPPISYLYTNNV